MNTIDGKIEKLQFEVFDWIKIPLILLVIFIHNFGDNDYALDFCLDNYYNIIRISISHVLAHVAVPCFFVISGYLFFRNFQTWNTKMWKSKIKRRFYTLFIPYIVWLSLFILLNLILGIRKEGLDFISTYFQEHNGIHLFWDCNLWNLDRTNILGMPIPGSAPILIPLWYLRDLMVITVLTPLIFIILRLSHHIGIFLFALIYLLQLTEGIPGLSSTSLFFYAFGSQFAIKKKNLISVFKRVETISYVIILPLFILEVMYDGHNTAIGDLIYPFYVIIGSVVVFNLSTRIVEAGKMKWFKRITPSVFFVFASHNIIIGYIRLIFSLVLPPIIVYLLVPFVTMSLCVGVYALLNRYTPSIGGIFSGNR